MEKTVKLSVDFSRRMEFIYKNWRGEVRKRTVWPILLWYGISPYHEGEQWFLQAYDLESDGRVVKDFALSGVIVEEQK